MALVHTPETEIGKSCPSFSLLGTDGKMHSLSDYKNEKPLVIMFICNHCPYVKAIEDRLISLGQDLKNKGVHLIGICSNDDQNYPEDSYENLKKTAIDKNYSFPYLHDKSQEVAKIFGAVCTPDFFVYDKNLKLTYRGRLDDSWKDPSKVNKRELYDFVLKLLEGEEVSKIQQTSSMGCSIKWINK